MQNAKFKIASEREQRLLADYAEREQLKDPVGGLKLRPSASYPNNCRAKSALKVFGEAFYKKLRRKKPTAVAKKITATQSLVRRRPSTKAFYDIILDGKPAELKKMRSHNHIVREAKEAVRKKGAEIVVFEFDRMTEAIQLELNKLRKLGIECRYYYSDNPSKIYEL